MFNGYNDTPPLISFNDFDQEKEKKQENVSKWSYGYDASGPPAQTSGHNHQPEFWPPKPNFLGNTPAANASSKCNCSGCYSTDNQSYQNVSTRHRPWLPRTFPVPLNGSGETCKLPEYHQLDGMNLTSQGSCFPDTNDVTPPYFQENNGKQPHYRHYQNSRLSESNQPGVIASSVNSDFAKKDIFQNQKEEIQSNMIGQDLSFLRQNGTRQPVHCNTAYGIIRNVEARLNNRNRGPNICDSLEKYSNVELYRHPSSVASYSLDQHISRPSVVEPYIKAVPSNLNQNRVPSIGHRNSKENMSQAYVDKIYNESKKNISSDIFQSINGEKKAVLPSTFQSPLIKEGITPENYQTTSLHGLSSPMALNLKNNGIPIDCTYFNMNRDFSKSCGNLSEAETQKLVYMSNRYTDYFSKNNLPDVIKRNNQNHILESKKEYAISQINQKNYYEQQQTNTFHKPNLITSEEEYLESNNAKTSFGTFYPKELDSTKIAKPEMFDLLQDNPTAFQRKEEIIKNENLNVNVHPRLSRPAPVFNDPRAVCAPSKSQNCFSSPNGASIPFGNFVNPDYSYQGHHIQGHHTYPYPHSSVPVQRNDLNQYNHGNIYPQISHSSSQPLTIHANSTIIFNSQAQPLTNSDLIPQQFCAAKNQLPSNNFDLKSSIPQNEKPKISSPFEVKKPNYLETIRSEEICKNGNSKISPLRLLRKKKFINQINEISNETTPPANSDSVPTLDVRKFWSTWADEEEENIAPTQVVVLDCQNIGIEEAKLLHLYENEPVRALHLENGNVVTFRETDCDNILSNNINEFDGSSKDTRIQNEPTEVVNEVKNKRDEILNQNDAAQEAINQKEEILPLSKSFSENLSNEKIPMIFEDKTKITGVELTATKFAAQELTTHSKTVKVPPATNETKCNLLQGNSETIYNKKLNVDKKLDEAIKLDKWTEKKFDFLKKAEESKAAEILRNSEEKKKIFERRYSFQQCNFLSEAKKISKKNVSNADEDQNSPSSSERKDSPESHVVRTQNEESVKNCSSNVNSPENLPSNIKTKFFSLPTSEYRRNKFLNYSENKITPSNDLSNAQDDENMANIENSNNCHDKEKPKDSNKLNETLPDRRMDDIKNEDDFKLEHSKNSWKLKNKDTLEPEEKKFQSQNNECSSPLAKPKEETEFHIFEMDDILQKMSNINFHGSDVKADSCLDKVKNHETKPVKIKKLKTLSSGKKIKKGKKLIHKQKSEDLKNLESENISVGKPTIKFSIQKLHDLKISFKVLNGSNNIKNYEKYTKDDEFRDKKIECSDNSIFESNNSTELITLKLKSIQKDDKANDLTKSDQKLSRNGILKKKKKRFKRKKLGLESSLTSEVKPHKIKNKKAKHVIQEERDPLEQELNDEILLSVVEKQSDKYSSSDDFQVQETVDSAKIKLTFKRHKASSKLNSLENEKPTTDFENQSNCKSWSSETENPLSTEKSILKFDSPPEKDLQFVKSEANWFEDFSKTCNNLDGVCEENQPDCNSTSSPNRISSPCCNSEDNYNNDSLNENKSSPKNISVSFIDIEDQCNSHDLENAKLSGKNIKKAENEISDTSNEEKKLKHYLSEEKFEDIDQNNINSNNFKNKKSNFSYADIDSEECQTAAKSLKNDILHCDEDTNQTEICDDSFMGCGPDVEMESENFEVLEECKIQIKDPLKDDPHNTERDVKMNFVDIEKSINEELIHTSMPDTKEDACVTQINSQLSTTEKRFTDSERFSNEVDPLTDEMELIRNDVEEVKINENVDADKLSKNPETDNTINRQKNNKSEKSDYSTNQVEHSKKNNGSYESKSDVKVGVSENINFLNCEENNNCQIVQNEKESILEKEILKNLPEETSVIETRHVESSPLKRSAENISEFSLTEKTCAENENVNFFEAKNTSPVLELNENNLEGVTDENIDKNDKAIFFQTDVSNIKNSFRINMSESKEQEKICNDAEPIMELNILDNTGKRSKGKEKNCSVPQTSKCEDDEFLNDRLDVDFKNKISNLSTIPYKLTNKNNFMHLCSNISNNIISANTDTFINNNAEIEANQFVSTLAESHVNESYSNSFKKNFDTINKDTEMDISKEELILTEESRKNNENNEYNKRDNLTKEGINNENGGRVYENTKTSDKTESTHFSNSKNSESKKAERGDEKETNKSKIICSQSNNSAISEKTKFLSGILKELTCAKLKKIQRRHSFPLKNFLENKSSKISESQKPKNCIIPFSKLKYVKSETRPPKAKSCPPLEFSYSEISSNEIVILNCPVEDIPLPPGDPHPENCFDFVEYFKKKKLKSAIKSDQNSSLETDPNQLKVNENTYTCLNVDSKINKNSLEDNQNDFCVSQKEISQLICSPVNCESPFQFSDLQNCRNPSPPPNTGDEDNLVDAEKNVGFSKPEINKVNLTSSGKIDLEINSSEELTDKLIFLSSPDKLCDEEKVKSYGNSKTFCLEEISENKQNKNSLLTSIQLPEKTDIKEKKKKANKMIEETEAAIKDDIVKESLTNESVIVETVQFTDNSEDFDKSIIENHMEIVCDNFNFDENEGEDLTVIEADTQNTDLEFQNRKFVEDKFYECEDIPTSEDLPNDDDIEVEKVSDDDKFRNMMQNCLDNAKKFLNVSNLKLFSCSVENLLEMDCQFTDVPGEDSEPEKLPVDPTNHISKDVLLTSCDNEVNDDLVFSEKFQLNDLTVDFVPSFSSEGSHNLCPEILPVDNWPYLEEEVPSSPTKSKGDETDLILPLENDISFAKSNEEQEVTTYASQSSLYSKNKVNKIRDNFDKLVNSNIVSLPNIKRVDFKRFGRKSVVSESEKFETNSTIGFKRRKTIDCLVSNKLPYSVLNKDMQNFKTEVAKLRSGLEKIEHLWRKSKSLKSSLNIEKFEKKESKDGESVKKIHSSFEKESKAGGLNDGSKHLKSSYCRTKCSKLEEKCKRDNIGNTKSAVLQKETNNFNFKSPTWQPKVLLLRISKKELKKMNKSTFPYLNEDDCRRISQENFNKQEKNPNKIIEVPDERVKDENLKHALIKKQNSKTSLNKDFSCHSQCIKEDKNDKVKLYVKPEVKDFHGETEKLSSPLYKEDNFKNKTEHFNVSLTLSNDKNSPKKEKYCENISFAFTKKDLEKAEVEEVILPKNQVASIKRKKSRFRNLHSKKRSESSNSDKDDKISFNKNLPKNPTLVETERILSELFKDYDAPRDSRDQEKNSKDKTKTAKEFANNDRSKEEDIREKRKNRQDEQKVADFPEKRVKNFKENNCAQNIEFFGFHSKKNSEEHSKKRNSLPSFEKSMSETGFLGHKKLPDENSKHNKNKNSFFQKDVEKSRSKYKGLEKHKDSNDTKEILHPSDHRQKKKHDREKEEKQEINKLKDHAHSPKKDLPIREEICKKSKLKESFESSSSRSSDGIPEKRMKIEAPNLEGPWMCEVCGFNDASERVNHIKSHPFHCQSCHLAFNTEAHFINHLTKMHKDIKNQHHCLLCELSFDTENEYQKHLETREHKHLESVEKNTINTLFTLLTGQPCPVLGLVEMKPEWLPNQAGMVHFYHQATPLSLALQYLKMHHDLTSFSTLSSVNSL